MWVPVNASAVNIHYDFQAPDSTGESVQSLVSFAKDNSTLLAQIANGNNSVSGSYDIYTSLCFPTSKPFPTTVQFLTHGLGFDHAYWDIPELSYVDAATTAGYAVFSYDRLGSGQSSKPDPVQMVQAPLHLAIAQQLLERLRYGYFSGHKFSKVVAVGHSYGSVLTEALTATAPELVDAAVLTGFSVDFSGIGSFLMALNLNLAKLSNISRFKGSASGYLLSSSQVGWQTGFFTAPNFDEQVMLSSFANASSISFGELFSRKNVTVAATGYKGPVLIVNGDSDLPYCSGNCTFPTNKGDDALKSAFALSRNASSFVVAGTGHALNLHRTAGAAYMCIMDFLKASGV